MHHHSLDLPPAQRPGRDGSLRAAQASGADVVQEPTEQPHGVRDCAFRDPVGNLIRINELG
jgi:predicted enzyme related to lactoylglutathione lyase